MAQEVSTLTKRQVHKFCFYILFQLSTFSCNFINLNLKKKKKQQIEEKTRKKVINGRRNSRVRPSDMTAALS